MLAYRMTHIDNIPHILQYGVTKADSPNANPHYVPIGDVQLISTRRNKAVAAVDGTIFVLGDYIPFYFWVRMPMLYVIQKGGNFVVNRTLPQDIVYIVVDVAYLDATGLPYYFSDGHAVDNLTRFYPPSYMPYFDSIVDWNAITANKWSGEGIARDLKRRKQAELLVAYDIPPQGLLGFICYDYQAARKLNSFGIPDMQIRIVPQAAYY